MQVSLNRLYTFFFLVLLFSSCADGVLRGIEREVIMPIEIPKESSYCFVHILREKDCSVCSISTLYLWEDTLRMVGRDDIYYLFIIEPGPDDTEKKIQMALQRHAFHQTVFVDYDHSFLKHNRWLKRNKRLDSFLVKRNTSRIIAIGDPMRSFGFLNTMRTL